MEKLRLCPKPCFSVQENREIMCDFVEAWRTMVSWKIARKTRIGQRCGANFVLIYILKCNWSQVVYVMFICEIPIGLLIVYVRWLDDSWKIIKERSYMKHCISVYDKIVFYLFSSITMRWSTIYIFLFYKFIL